MLKEYIEKERNAIDELKARADYVTTDVENDGIYNACKALGLF